MKKLVGLLLTVCVLGSAGCGKKDLPVPRNTDEVFAWDDISVTMSESGLLSVSGTVSGAYRNVKDVVFQLEPVLDDCEGCPFVPVDFFPVDVNVMWDSPDSRDFHFVVMPPDGAVEYRWRLMGYSVVESMPAVRSTVQRVAPPLLIEKPKQDI